LLYCELQKLIKERFKSSYLSSVAEPEPHYGAAGAFKQRGSGPDHDVQLG
jgi:hypothetical protein